jgi:DNA-binding PadR family transcriptional regulator
MMEVHLEEVAETLNDMVEKGLLEREPIISPEGELDELYSFTPEGKKKAEELGLPIPPELDPES